MCAHSMPGPDFDYGDIMKPPATVGPFYCPSNADVGYKSHARSFIWGIAPYVIKPIYHFGLANQWDVGKSRVSTEARWENPTGWYK